LSDDQEKAIGQAQSALGKFAERFDDAYYAGLRSKLGLFTARDGDPELANDLLKAMADNAADFTLTFRRLSEAALGPEGDAELRKLFADPAAFDTWAVRWRQRISDESQDGVARRAAMRAVNPAFIPRNHRVEAVIEAAVNRNDFVPFEQLLTVLSKPFEDTPAFASYAEPPKSDERVLQTFCGT
jgi:uncharacterized protein YdiU (UPF0061 family)